MFGLHAVQSPSLHTSCPPVWPCIFTLPGLGFSLLLLAPFSLPAPTPWLPLHLSASDILLHLCPPIHFLGPSSLIGCIFQSGSLCRTVPQRALLCLCWSIHSSVRECLWVLPVLAGRCSCSTNDNRHSFGHQALPFIHRLIANAPSSPIRHPPPSLPLPYWPATYFISFPPRFTVLSTLWCASSFVYVLVSRLCISDSYGWRHYVLGWFVHPFNLFSLQHDMGGILWLVFFMFVTRDYFESRRIWKKTWWTMAVWLLKACFFFCHYLRTLVGLL